MLLMSSHEHDQHQQEVPLDPGVDPQCNQQPTPLEQLFNPSSAFLAPVPAPNPEVVNADACVLPSNNGQQSVVHPTLQNEQNIVNQIKQIQQQHQLGVLSSSVSSAPSINAAPVPSHQQIEASPSIQHFPSPANVSNALQHSQVDPKAPSQPITAEAFKQQQQLMPSNLMPPPATAPISATQAAAMLPFMLQQAAAAAAATGGDSRLFMAPQMANQPPMFQPQVMAFAAAAAAAAAAAQQQQQQSGNGGMLALHPGGPLDGGNAVASFPAAAGDGAASEAPLPSPHSLFYRDGSRRMRGGVIEPFPEKLHRLLVEVEAAGRGDVISFVASGRAFCIHKPDHFFKDIVPLYFRQSRLSSFKRQLNLYGFELINTGPARGGYYHEMFIKEQPELCRRMRRVAVKVVKEKNPAASNEDTSHESNQGQGGDQQLR